jgi:molybdopterin-guanine dinucleotide biosynthesis protein B
MRIFGITGKKNTGKTTLVTLLIPELKKIGFKVGTIKKTHSGFDIVGRDTEKHSDAGAEIVGGIGEETLFKVNKTMKLHKVLQFMKEIEDLDFIILEGFKKSPYLKIATTKYTNSDETIAKIVDVNKISKDKDMLNEIIDLIQDKSYGILQNLNCKKCGYNTCEEFRKAKINGIAKREIQCLTDIDTAILKVDNEIIPMNPFVNSIVQNIVNGLVDSLRTDEFGAKSIKKIELKIQNKDIEQK